MIAFASRTGNVRYVASQLNVPIVEIAPQLRITEPFILFTYTDALGAVPASVEAFMRDNSAHCVGIFASGNQNFGHDFFARAGDVLAATYRVPLLKKIDVRGTKADYEHMKQLYNDLMKVGYIQ